MIGEYQDPLLSSTRSPYASPARTTSRTSLSYTSNPLLDSPGRSARQSIDSKRQSFSTGRDSPVAGPSSGRTAIESPMSKYRTSRLQDLEDEQGEEDSEYTKTVKRINGLQLAQAPSFDDDEEEPAPSTSPTKPPSFRPPLPVKASSPTKPAVSPRPDSPASSVGTSASSSTNPASGVGYKSNLGILGNSGPDQCRRCGTTVYFAEKVIAGGHKCVHSFYEVLRQLNQMLRTDGTNAVCDARHARKRWIPICWRRTTCRTSCLLSSWAPPDTASCRYCKRCYDEQYGIRSQGFVLVRPMFPFSHCHAYIPPQRPGLH